MVGTILLLALTVTLFGSIFFFVSTFPTPIPQSATQFQARLVYSYSGSGVPTNIVGISILHLSGPQVPGTAVVYIRSASQPNKYPSYTVSSGIGGAAVWVLGQTWSVNLTSNPDSLPDNITLYLVSQNTLLFSAILPGQQTVVPPTFLAGALVPFKPTWQTTPVSTGENFSVLAAFSGALKGTVYANLQAVYGFSLCSARPMWYNTTSGYYQWNSTPSSANCPTSIAQAGAYQIVVNASNVQHTPANGVIGGTIVGPYFAVSSLRSSNAYPTHGKTLGLYASVLDMNASSRTGTLWVFFNYTWGTATTVAIGNVSGGTIGPFGYVLNVSAPTWTLPNVAGRQYLVTAIAKIYVSHLVVAVSSKLTLVVNAQ